MMFTAKSDVCYVDDIGDANDIDDKVVLFKPHVQCYKIIIYHHNLADCIFASIFFLYIM